MTAATEARVAPRELRASATADARPAGFVR